MSRVFGRQVAGKRFPKGGRERDPKHPDFGHDLFGTLLRILRRQSVQQSVEQLSVPIKYAVLFVYLTFLFGSF